jgi:hypothetical protein
MAPQSYREVLLSNPTTRVKQGPLWMEHPAMD